MSAMLAASRTLPKLDFRTATNSAQTAVPQSHLLLPACMKNGLMVHFNAKKLLNSLKDQFSF